MKKDMVKGQKQKWTSRRLSLSRETLLVLHDPALLELARGGKVDPHSDTSKPSECD